MQRWISARVPPGVGAGRCWRRDAARARYCAASHLIEAGLNDLELTATIGHSDSRTTKRIDGHLDRGRHDRREARRVTRGAVSHTAAVRLVVLALALPGCAAPGGGTE
jgi:hypothetical protein